MILKKKMSISANCVSGEGLWFSVGVTEEILPTTWDVFYCFFLVRTSSTYCEDFPLFVATWGNSITKLTLSVLWEMFKILQISG